MTAADLDIIQENAVYLHVDCEESIARELRDYFSYYAPNFMFHPKYKNKMWDGKIRLFNFGTGTILRGLLPHIIKFAKERKYTVNVKLQDKATTYSVDEANAMIDSIPISFDGKPGALRDYQRDLVVRGLTKGLSTILSPTSSGKSAVIYMLTRLFRSKKTLILVPTILLRDQLLDNFKEFSELDVWDADNNVHIIKKGKKNSNKPIIISTWQSVWREKPNWFKQFDTILMDECHGCEAKCLNGIGKHSTNAYNRIGLTGTLKDTETHILQIEGILGQVYEGWKTKELMDAGYISTIDIKSIVMQWPDSVCKEINTPTPAEKKKKKKPNVYRNEINHIVSSTKRNQLITTLAEKVEGNVLILFQLVDKHGKPLYNMMENQIKSKNLYFIYGGTDVEDRNNIRKIVDLSRDNVVCASYGTLSTGVDIKNIDAVFFASPYKSKIKVLQSIGRGLRKSKTKDHVTLYDFVDDFSVGQKKGYLFKHFLERLKLYKKEKFNVKVTEIKF